MMNDQPPRLDQEVVPVMRMGAPVSRNRATPRAIAIAVAAFVSLFAPVWAPRSVPVTCDGPSHLYNAMQAGQARSGKQPAASLYSLRPFPRSNFLSDSALRLLGRAAGWEPAERIWLTAVLLLQFCSMYWALRGVGAAPRILIAAWVASNYFTWMGFYDFALSGAFLVLFSAALLGPSFPARRAALALLFVCLYASHVLGLAVAVTLSVWVLSCRAIRGGGRWAELGIVAPGIILLVLEFLSGSSTRGETLWAGWVAAGKSAAGLLCGDFLISYTWLGIPAGLGVMALVWAALVRQIRSRKDRPALGDGVVFLVLAMFAASILSPDQLGAGSIVAARIRFLAVLIALASFVRNMSGNRILRSPALTMSLSSLLMIQSFIGVRMGYAVAHRANAIEQALRESAVPQGAWVSARLPEQEETAARTHPFRHIPERVYLRTSASALENYEASLGNFEIRWRLLPDRLAFAPEPVRGWSVSRGIREVRWNGPVWVVHAARWPLTARDKTLRIGKTQYHAGLAVTPVEVR